MNRGKRTGLWLLLSGLVLIMTSGCQTYFWRTGQTLPSPYYLDHPPQFIPEGEDFPLPNELATSQKAAQNLTPLAIPQQ